MAKKYKKIKEVKHGDRDRAKKKKDAEKEKAVLDMSLFDRPLEEIEREIKEVKNIDDVRAILELFLPIIAKLGGF